MTAVLVTGAAGFIGRHLCRLLAASGRTVMAIGHGSWTQAEVEATGVKCWKSADIEERNLDDLAARFGVPEHVFHLAGGSSVAVSLCDPAGDFRRTVDSTAKLLEWLRRAAPATKLAAISSAAVYGAGHAGPISEDAPLRPQSPYGYHKLMMEELLRSYAQTYCTSSVIVRLFSVYGAGLRKQLIWDLCSRLSQGASRLELQGTGNEMRDWTDVRDTVRAIELASHAAGAEVPVINVGSGTGTSVREIARLTTSAWHGGSTAVSVLFSGGGREGDPFSLQAEASRLRALGFSWEIAVREGIADYVRWFRAQADCAA